MMIRNMTESKYLKNPAQSSKVKYSYVEIETHHVQAVRQFMKWLQYKNHRNQFIFINNKADHCDSKEQKVEDVAGMLELLGAK